MLTAIEEFLFTNDTAHHVFEFAMSWRRLVLKLAPSSAIETEKWDQLTPPVIAEFDDLKMTGIDVGYCAAEDLNLPWDIIGFECQQLRDDRWSFVMHTSGGEYCFEARWPRLIGE